MNKPGAKAAVKDNIYCLRPRDKILEIVLGLGVFLEDGDGILQGNGRYKRQIVLKSMQDYKHEQIKNLIMQSYYYDGKSVLYKLLPNDDYQALRKGI